MTESEIKFDVFYISVHLHMGIKRNKERCDGETRLCKICWEEIRSLLSNSDCEIVKRIFVIEGENDGNTSDSVS